MAPANKRLKGRLMQVRALPPATFHCRIDKGNDMGFLIVFLGSGLGGACRYGIGVISLRLFGPDAASLGTFGINVAGSFLMAVVAEYFAWRGGFSQTWRLFLTTGIIGGFTTFSTFSLDAVTLYQRGQLGWSSAYVIGSVVVSLVAFFLGLAAIRSVMAP